jgi:hypothetical protein
MGTKPTPATICVDPGWRNFAISVISQDTLVYSQVWDLTYGISFKLFKDKVANWREVILIHLQRYLCRMEKDCQEASWLQGEWTLLVEKQISQDLIWLTGIVQGVFSCRPFPFNLGPLYRSCDACKAFGIPASKKIICRDDKKRRTEALVKEQTGFDIDTDHEADAVLLYMYHNKRRKLNN